MITSVQIAAPCTNGPLALGGSADPITSVTGSGSQYYVTVASEQEGTYNLDVAQDNDIVDASNNSLSSRTPTGDDQEYTVTISADTTDPVITLAGSSSVSVALGATYTDAGATCIDGTDGDISSDIVTSNPVNTNVAQTYVVSYTCTDAANNSVSAYRTVTVTAAADTTDPVITLAGSSSVSVALGATYTDAGATCIDDTDGDISSDIVTSNPVNTNVAQTYVVSYTCTDNASNSVSAYRTVTVTAAADTTDPVITLVGSSSVSVALGATYTDAGATCIDGTDGDISSDIVTSNPVNTNVAQTYYVIYTCTDAANNSAYAYRTVTVTGSAPSVTSITRYDPSTQTTDSDTLQFKVTFSEAVTGVGTDDFELSPDSTGGGTTITTNNNNAGNSGQFTQTSSPDLPITDNTAISDTITVSGSDTVASVSVAVDITHTYIGDLKVELITPDGPNKTLHNRAGGSANDIDQTYTPNFGSDIEINGDWTLKIRDNANGDTGTLNSWTLTIDYTDGSTTTTTTTTTNPITAVSGSGSQYYVTVASEQEGTYNLDVAQDNDIVDASNNSLSSRTPTGDDQEYTVTISADTTDPVITLAGSSSVSVALGATYTDAGATCIDDTDGDISSDIVTSNPVNTNVAQTYVVSYTCTDNASNSASAYRTVTVTAAADTTDPVITLVGSSSVSVALGATYTDAGATCIDGTDGDISSDIVTSNPVNTNVAQTYTVVYTCTDAANNSAYAYRSVTVTGSAPSVTSITRYDPSTQTTDSDTLQFKVTFSEAVTGVGTDDFELSSGSPNGGTQTSTYTSSPSLAIPYDTTKTDTITVTDSGTASSVSVSVNIEHDYIADLLVQLVAPDGTIKTLHNRGGGGADDIVKTYTLSYDDVSINGNWQLRIHDNFSADSGTLHEWTLALGGSADPITSVTGSGSQYYVTVASEQEGTYNLDVAQDNDIVDASNNSLSSRTPTGDDQEYTVTISADTTDPVITLAGSSSVSVALGATYTDAGATCIDGTDGDISSDIVTSNPVNTNVAQTYVVSYTCTDAANNSVSAYRTVTVTAAADTTDPVITLVGSSSVSVALGATYTDAGATCIDGTDGDISSDIVTSNPVNTNVAQTYVVSYTCTDAANNSAYAYRTVTVTAAADTTDPVITLLGSSSVSVALGATYTDAGATCIDGTDGDISSDIVTSNPVNTNVAQTYYVIYTCTDAANNSADEYRIVTVTGSAPSVTSITRYDPSTQTTDSDTLQFKVTFSEAVTGVGTDDFELSSGSPNGGTQTSTYTSSPSLAIPYDTTKTDTITVTDSGTASSVSVSVNIEHDYIADLLVQLVAPDGTIKTLHNRGGGGADDIVKTYTLSYDDVSINGNWQLRIHDNFSADSGTLHEWTLALGGSADPITSVTGSGSQYYVTVASEQEGTYNLDVAQDNDIVDASNNSLSSRTPTGDDQEYTVTISADTTDPVITLAGSSSVSVALGATYTDAGATCIDGTDGDISSDIVTSNPVNTNVAQTYYVIYTCTDAANNSVSAYRTVTVTAAADTTDPVITLVGSSSVSVALGATYTDAGATCIDGTDGDISSDIVTSNPVNTNVAQTYYVIYTCTDAANNSAYAYRTVTVTGSAPSVTSITRYDPSTQTTDSDTLQFKVTFSEAVTGVGTDDFELSPDSTGGGTTITTNNNNAGNSGQFTQTSSPDLPITDNTAISDTITVSGSDTVASVSVAVDITHTYIGDLKVELITPDGPNKTLHNRAGGSANDIDQTYTPNFGSDIEINGGWTLKIRDNANGDTGTLNSWTLTIDYTDGSTTTTTTTTTNPITAVSGSGSQYYVTVASEQEGTYNLGRGPGQRHRGRLKQFAVQPYPDGQ